MNYQNPDFLVDCNWLHENQDTENLVIVDCGLSDYAFKRAHIPGAVYHGGNPYLIRTCCSVVIEEKQFSEIVSALGINNESTVVLYDDFDSKHAARFWWILRYHGFNNVKLLNGGWQAWLNSGRRIAVGEISIIKSNAGLSIQIKDELLATKEWLLKNYNSRKWKILDVRSVEEYEGKDDRGNKRSGHIPGAIHWEWSNALIDITNPGSIHTFKPAEDIQNQFDKIGLRKEEQFVTYCQAGVRASLAAFTLELMGYNVTRMYDSSMSEWANVDYTPLE